MTTYPTTPLVPPNCQTDQDRYLLTYVRHEARLMRELSDRHYCGVADFILRHGRFWNPAPLPRSVKPMPIKMCYHNSRLLAQRRKGFRYVEGVALGIIPVHHAWCVDPHGNVIDATWASVDRTGMKPEEFDGIGSSYFGVEFPIAMVRDIINGPRARRLAAQSVFFGAPDSFWLEPFAAKSSIALANEMINSQEGGKDIGNFSAQEKDATDQRRSAVEVSGEESGAADTGLPYGRRSGSVRSWNGANGTQ